MVPYVFVQSQTSDSSQWILVMRPGESAIEDIDRSILYFLGFHDLHAEDPRGEFALLDLVEEIFDMVIGFRSCQSLGSLAVHSFDSCLRSEVPLDVDEASILSLSVNVNESCKAQFTYLLVQSVCVYAESVDVLQ